VGWFKLKGELNAIQGRVSVGRSTKQLLRSIEPRRIAVIHHQDLDEMAASGLIEAKVKAVINAAPSMSGKYPITGPLKLIRAGIPIFEIEEPYFDWFKEDMEIHIDDHVIRLGQHQMPCSIFTEERWKGLTKKAELNLGNQLSLFIDNTLHYARQEKDFVINPLLIPPFRTLMANRHVVVVVRGSGYKNDLFALKDYIEDYRPVLIGVDGGADALIEYGYHPHIIIGDMDSISDEALLSDADILVHAYPDGRAPGMKRINELGIKAQTIAAKGTSEDIAMLIAFEKNAELIVTLGTHTHMIDFLEKGRKGMASTMLVRMKIGSKLIDAKGVSKLYHRRIQWKQLWFVPAAGLFPLIMLGLIHPGLRQFMDMLWIYVKLTVMSV
jgi:uncharacterized membrane-anchored protein